MEPKEIMYAIGGVAGVLGRSVGLQRAWFAPGGSAWYQAGHRRSESWKQ